MSARVPTAAGTSLENKRRPGPDKDAGPAFRLFPDSYATILVSNGCKPDKMLAPSAVVLENGQADPGTGQTPTVKTGRNRLSRSRNWTKLRTEIQESTRPAKTVSRLWPRVKPGINGATARNIEALCI